MLCRCESILTYVSFGFQRTWLWWVRDKMFLVLLTSQPLFMGWWWEDCPWQSNSPIPLQKDWLFWNINICVFPCIAPSPFPKSNRQKNAASWKVEIVQHTSCLHFWFQMSKLVKEVQQGRWNHKEWDGHRRGSPGQWELMLCFLKGPRQMAKPQRYLTVVSLGRPFPELWGSCHGQKFFCPQMEW